MARHARFQNDDVGRGLRLALHHPTQLLGMSKNEGLGPTSPPRIPGFTRLSSQIYNLKFALIESSSSPEMAKSQALQSNLDVDYVVSYRFAKTGKCTAAAGGGMCGMCGLTRSREEQGDCAVREAVRGAGQCRIADRGAQWRLAVCAALCPRRV
jgi:hypothetical protein